MEMLVSERPRRLADHVYSTLRQAILAGELQPGERLRQEQLRASFAVSASPVREALNRLASDGLVVIHPEPTGLFEVPIVLPLPEVVNFIP